MDNLLSRTSNRIFSNLKKVLRGIKNPANTRPTNVIFYNCYPHSINNVSRRDSERLEPLDYQLFSDVYEDVVANSPKGNLIDRRHVKKDIMNDCARYFNRQNENGPIGSISPGHVRHSYRDELKQMGYSRQSQDDFCNRFLTGNSLDNIKVEYTLRELSSEIVKQEYIKSAHYADNLIENVTEKVLENSSKTNLRKSAIISHVKKECSHHIEWLIKVGGCGPTVLEWLERDCDAILKKLGYDDDKTDDFRDKNYSENYLQMMVLKEILGGIYKVENPQITRSSRRSLEPFKKTGL